MTERPRDNNADAWHAWLIENKDASVAFIAVQIAEAMDEREARSDLLNYISYPDLCLLARTFCQHESIAVGQPGYRINEWLKQRIARANIDSLHQEAGE